MIAFLSSRAAACGVSEETEGSTPTVGDESANWARDGNIAIREEFDAALEKNTLKAWTLFIARHPDHPLTERAKEHASSIRD